LTKRTQSAGNEVSGVEWAGVGLYHFVRTSARS